MRVTAPLCRTEELIGRRASIRHRLNLSARITAPGVNLRVQLEDISTTGACVRLMSPRVLTCGRLKWLSFTAFGRVVWQKDLRCGIAFEETADEECLRQTLEFNGLIGADAADKYGRLASAWVHGPGDW